MRSLRKHAFTRVISNPSEALMQIAERAERRKFGNKKTVIDGLSFDSLKEGRRYQALKLLQRAGEISDLEVHPKYVLTAHGQKIGTYSPDFRYRRAGKIVVEDVKSVATQTQLFRWKARHMLAEHGVTVEVV